MKSPTIYTTTFRSIRDTDTVADATRRMLDERVFDLPVIDASAAFVGMFKLNRLYALLLPKAALMDRGLADLTFVSDSLVELREKMREIEGRQVREFTVKPDHVVHPATSPLEVVLLLHKGANNIPVIAPDTGALVGMVSARDLLAALQPEGTK